MEEIGCTVSCPFTLGISVNHSVFNNAHITYITVYLPPQNSRFLSLVVSDEAVELPDIPKEDSALESEVK